MSEPIWCDINVKYPAAWGERPWFVEELAEALINGSDDVEAGLAHVNGEGNYGLHDDGVEAILTWLVDQRIPFTAHSEAKYEFWADDRRYDGATDTMLNFDGDTDRVMMSEDTYMSIVDGRHPDYSSVEGYFAAARRALDDYDISHLPTECPQIEEE